MAKDDLHPFMQAYLNISAEIEGLEGQELHSLLAREVAESPESLVAQGQWGPAWLPLAEKLRLHRREQDKSLSNSGPDSR